jgi:NAD-dependent dihydropyrimidine dehydrogenase PreA subunit
MDAHPTVHIEERGCRDCRLCVEICPTKVFDQNDARQLAEVKRDADCIGCTSCKYLCPSGCIDVDRFVAQRPFHRLDANAALVARFLQKQPAAATLTDDDFDEARRDVGVRLMALGASVTETMGRGVRAVGRKAGSLAASHLPEMYEGASLEDVLARMKRRFAGSFDFEATVEPGGEVRMTFPKCALGRVVTEQGQKIGDAMLCGLFHEYWAGLLGAFTGRNYAVEMTETGGRCVMRLQARG